MGCNNCEYKNFKLKDDQGWGDWLKLMNYFEHELTEGEITDKTYEVMTDALMTFKPWIEIKPEKK